MSEVVCERWPFADRPLKEIIERRNGRLLPLSVSEPDSMTNTLSRALIVATRREKGAAFLYKINLYDGDRHKRDAICTEFTGQMVCNFDFAAVAPVKDDRLIDLIHERDTTPYTNGTDDATRLGLISNRLHEIGGLHLFWS